MLPNIQPEPWRVEIVEPILRIDRAAREECLRRAGYNAFGKSSEDTHLEYVTDVTTRLLRELAALRGVKIARQAPLLRHFTAQFELL